MRLVLHHPKFTNQVVNHGKNSAEATKLSSIMYRLEHPLVRNICCVFLHEFHGLAWAVGKYNIGPPADGISKKTLNFSATVV